MTITQTNDTVVLTSSDGIVTRLATNGKKIKDDSTKIERKTKWDAGRLVSEISGAGPGKITETYSVDPEHHQLMIVLKMENPRTNQPRLIHRVYDLDQK